MNEKEKEIEEVLGDILGDPDENPSFMEGIQKDIERPESDVEYIKALETRIEDLEYQNQQLMDTISGEHADDVEPDLFDGDDEFESMLDKMDEVEERDKMVLFYSSIISQRFEGFDWFRRFEHRYLATRETPLVIPKLKENWNVGELCYKPDEVAKEIMNYPKTFMWTGIHSNLYDLSTKKEFSSGKNYVKMHYEGEEEEYMREDKILTHIASSINMTLGFNQIGVLAIDNCFGTKSIVVSYADFFVWVINNPNASIWAFRVSDGDPKENNVHFYYSENGNVIHMLPYDYFSGATKVIRNELENPDMQLIILLNDNWKSIEDNELKEGSRKLISMRDAIFRERKEDYTVPEASIV